MNGVPVEHISDAQSLDGQPYRNFYEIQLYPSGSLYLTPEATTLWQGKTYENWGVDLTGLAQSSDDKAVRPKFSLANFTYDESGEPIRGVFSALHAQGAIEGATIIWRKVLVQHVETNSNIKQEKRWRVARLASETPNVIVLELRNTLDGPRFTIPARKFLPPEFPQVKLY